MNVDRRKSNAKWPSVEVEKSKRVFASKRPLAKGSRNSGPMKGSKGNGRKAKKVSGRSEALSLLLRLALAQRLRRKIRAAFREFAAEYTLVYQLMREHGLMDWYCEIVNLEGPWGHCNSERKTIYLDRDHVLRGSKREVRETILHEIAHALEPDGGRHNRRWQERARCIGVSEREIARYRRSNRPLAKGSRNPGRGRNLRPT